MPKMKVFRHCAALLLDLVDSRHLSRGRAHSTVLAAIDEVNATVPALDLLRVTVGDEMQGVYETVGAALRAAYLLRFNLMEAGVDLRAGIGGGEVRVVDAGRGIQDGEAWYRARDAIERAEALSRQPGHDSARTAVDDGREVATPLADATVRLVDASLAGLRDGARRSLAGLMQGLDNADVARAEGISPSANSQRVNRGGLRPLAETLEALFTLP